MGYCLRLRRRTGIPSGQQLEPCKRTAIKARLLAIPSRTARLVVGKSDFQEIYDLQMAENVKWALNDSTDFTQAIEKV
jgi:hypothetical protein